jgi:hypothetical protein
MRWVFSIVIDGIGGDNRFRSTSVAFPYIEISVISRKIAAGYTQPDSVTFLKDIAGGPQIYRKQINLSRSQGNRVVF